MNSNLQRIYLFGNGIRDDGARAIADALRVNSTLEVIELRYNGIGDDGVLAITEALQFNSFLLEINLYRNGIGDEKHRLVEKALEGCRNRQEQNVRLCVCSFIRHWRAEKPLNFDNHMFAFYLYPLLGIELRK